MPNQVFDDFMELRGPEAGAFGASRRKPLSSHLFFGVLDAMAIDRI